MNTYERRKKIVDLVNQQGSMMVSDIAKACGVTEATIRTDLRQLEPQKTLVRFHGGAASIHTSLPESPEASLSERDQMALDPKKQIAAAAAALVREGDTIILDSGSTTKMVAEVLAGQDNITVITNNLPAAILLAENKCITLVVCGGTVRHKTVSLHGSIAEYALRGVVANLMFVGADGLDVEKGITTFNEGFAISSVMASVARRVIVVADASKFRQRGFNVVLPMDKIDTIITDSEAPTDVIATLKEKQKTVIVV